MACIFGLLQNAEHEVEGKRRVQLPRQVVLEVFLPLLVALLSTLWVASLGESATEIGELIFGDILKVCSLFVIGVHTLRAVQEVTRLAGSVSDRAVVIYQCVGAGTLIVCIVLVAHAMILGLKPTYQLARDPLVTMIIATMSCLYLAGFLAGNVSFKRANPDNWGVKKWSDAFIWGANVPFLLAFLGVLLVFTLSHWTGYFGTQLESFLVGAVTFLVLSSAAANIFIDGYARPFLAIGNPIVVEGAVTCAHERLNSPAVERVSEPAQNALNVVGLTPSTQ
jgi:hypothetical protein